MHKYFRPFHIVRPSPWPIVMSLSLLVFTLSIAALLQNYQFSLTAVLLGAGLICLTFFFWFKDVNKESCYLGFHTSLVQTGIKFGFYLFVISEIFVFFSVFWAFFYASLSPNIEVGCVFPSIGITAFNPWSIPLLNTIILLSSGVSLTWSHHAIVAGNRVETILGLGVTIGLGLIFTLFQYIEYVEATFTIADSIYGTTFFGATGLRGVHVIVGTLFLTACLFRSLEYEFTKHHHLGFELAILYWHFVDIVRLFLFVVIYRWSY
jgi:cytochrome c oxidase subunit 3